ncbi:hypothetical protein HEK616_82410 (plasmid) [Streptomyces nigrescens]|uniref:Uncharacterized protein n=1 Tax=Streptomyces nigrescens TaxID=1920 RepID=A0ABN6R8Q9_STRNI|nr:hypothetical protein HEK616_82410 [Streptomyces nigrescens]
MRAGTSAVYVVSDEVDAVHRRVVDAGGEVLEAPHGTRFGSGATAYVHGAGSGGQLVDLRHLLRPRILASTTLSRPASTSPGAHPRYARKAVRVPSTLHFLLHRLSRDC